MLLAGRCVRVLFTLVSGAVLTNSAANSAVTPLSVLTGEWGGPQAKLVLGPTGGVMTLACASATISAPLRPDATGRFDVMGRYEIHGGGMVAADTPPAMVQARFSGRLDGSAMHLSVHRKGVAPEVYTLELGRRVKVIRCY